MTSVMQDGGQGVGAGISAAAREQDDGMFQRVSETKNEPFTVEVNRALMPTTMPMLGWRRTR